MSGRAGPAAVAPERLEARTAEIGGGLTIRRALPNRQRRTVGAWCFLDHAGPMDFGAGGGMHVGPHPHIGLQTFTWMIEGEVVHRDSLGNEQVITPGQVNLMTAGVGIAHAEDSAPGAAGRLHAAQLWIALPQAERRRPPAFRNHPHLPLIERGGFGVRVLAGSSFGESSPVEVYSPLLGLDLSAAGRAALLLPLDPWFEHAALVLSGSARIGGETLAPGMLLYFGTGREELSVECAAAARILVIGGTPFGEEILVWWNFVARTPAEIEQATGDWNAGRFGRVAGSPAPPLIAPSAAGLNLRPARP
ncbi:MAG TPA: pirin family protein [Steroidobacteraceae bacterium]|jgi:redox-sensitive bicupin YhaK (pirin superfamily)|nr:pirin family protein [Steroidobacteraceae bacterium]